MRSHALWTLVLLTLGSLLATPTIAQRTVDLRPRFIEGRTTWYEISQSMETRIHAPVAGMDRDENTSQTLLVRITDQQADPEGGGELDVVIERLQMQSPTGTDFDSDQPADKDGDNPIAPMLRNLVGKPLTARIDDEGIITEIRGLEGLFPRNPTGASLNGAFGPDAMKKLFQPVVSTGNGRNSARRVGSTWTTNSTVSLPTGDLKTNATHTLRSLSGSIARITVTGDIDMADFANELGMTIKNTSYQGRYRWDTDAGVLDSMTVEQRLEVTGGSDGLEMNIRTASKTTTARIPAPRRP